MSHVGYNVGRVLVEDSRESAGTKTVTLLLRPSNLPKHLCANSNNYPRESGAGQDPSPACRFCPSSCSTTSLGRARVCHHGETTHEGEEESTPLSANATKYDSEHGRKHTRRDSSKTANRLPHWGRCACVYEGTVYEVNSLLQPAAQPNLSHFSPPARETDLGTVYHVQPTTDLASQDAGRRAMGLERHREGPQESPSQEGDRPVRRMGGQGFSTLSRPAPNACANQNEPTASGFAHDKGSNPRWLRNAAQGGSSVNPTSAEGVHSVRLTNEFRPSVDTAAMQLDLSDAERVRALRERTAASQAPRSMPNQAPDSGNIGKKNPAAPISQTLTFATTKTTGPGVEGGVPSWSCDRCGDNFSVELELRRHQFMQHRDGKVTKRTNEGRFLCLMQTCEQSFVRRHVMERHFKSVHLLVKEFPCSTCDKSFADSTTRAAHRSAVHEKRKPYVCNHCSRCFTQSSSLGKHRRRFHQNPP
ncbi:unnamed protein product [Chondrus crispus]|uniref:C2H2-type domain-containing protein n=1 Tax=Chondrus crispus TaxID=2769 RepID=R7QM54_CHOCR|nr:unnamed protein product [Chondrus crispus]CDF38858.1 unnamed protein product [Chondrus crispus]|eukprot:XP_005718763.1 unnamed protein product [Chondrus crispus]